MNICFYTSDRPSVTSMINMHYLISQRPQHNYMFLKVRTPTQQKPGVMARLKKIYGEWRFDDGRFDFGRDLALLDKRLQKQIPAIDSRHFSSELSNAVNDSLSEQFLRKERPDVIIQTGAGILTENIFNIASRGTINLHHGLSPEIRGIESTFWCMYYGIKDKIGTTCHFIDATLDTGVIVKQQALGSSSVSFVDLQYENIMLGRDVLVQGVDILDRGGYTVRSLGEVPSYYFGLPGSGPYIELKKNNFHGVKNISEKAFKMKEKRILLQP